MDDKAGARLVCLGIVQLILNAVPTPCKRANIVRQVAILVGRAGNSSPQASPCLLHQRPWYSSILPAFPRCSISRSNQTATAVYPRLRVKSRPILWPVAALFPHYSVLCCNKSWVRACTITECSMQYVTRYHSRGVVCFCGRLTENGGVFVGGDTIERHVAESWAETR